MRKPLTFIVGVSLLVGVLGSVLAAGEGDYVCDGTKLWKWVDGALVDAGKQLLADDFSGDLSANWNTKGVAHCWKTIDKSLVTAGYGGALDLKADPGEAYVLEIKMKILENEPQKDGGFAGVNASGLLLTLQPSRMWWQYKVPGEERGRGSWKDIPVPFDQWYDFKIVRRRGGIYQWFVNADKVCEVIAPELKGGVALHANRMKTAYKDVRLYRIDAPESQKVEGNLNLVRNSSFEQRVDSLAPFWIPNRLRDIPFTYGSMEKFDKAWALDDTVSFDGKTSLRMGGSKINGVRSYFCEVQKDVPFTMSVYLKSNVDKMPVELAMPGAKKSVEVGREWQRFSVTTEKMPAQRIWLYVTPQSEDTVWVDAVQLELGSAPTGYKPNPLDATAAKSETAPIQPLTIPEIAGAPLMNGTLDDPLWNKAASFELMIPGNLPGRRVTPKEPTNALICHDANTLYIGIRCADSDVKTIRTNAKADDNGDIAADDSVEVFISKTLGDKAFYRLVVNSAGARLDTKGDDISWSADWTARVAQGDGCWTVAMAIPLSALELTPATGGVWGVNLCRGNPRTQEYSCSGPVTRSGMYFHQAANFTPVHWDDTGVFRPFCWKFEGMAFRREDTTTLSLVGEVVNSSGKSQDVKVVGDALGKHVESAPLSVGPGEKKIFCLPGFPDTGAKDCIARLKLVKAGNGELLRQEVVRPPHVSLMQATLDRSYYTSEKEASIHLSIAASENILIDVKLVGEVRHDGNVIHSFTKRALEISNLIPIPLTDIPVGTYQLRLSLHDGSGKEIAEASDTLRKLAPKPNEVKIDRIRRIILVNGEPYFPFAPLQVFHVPSTSPYGDYDDKIETMIKYWADNGFKTLVVGTNVDPEKGKWGERIWDKAFSSADAHGIKIITFWTGNWPAVLCDHARLEALISRWKDQPALLAWVSADEPEIYSVKPEDVAAGTMKIKQLDPYHPVFINYTQMGPGSRYAGLPGDIMSLDYYLTASEGRTVKDTLSFVDAMNEVAVPMHTPVWNFIAGSNLDNHPREPSPEEQTAQTYGNVIKGGSGLKYFFGQLAGKKHWKRFLELDKELRELSPVFLTGEELPLIKSDAADILVMARRHNDATYLLCVNVDDNPHTGVVDLSPLKLPGSDGGTFAFLGGLFSSFPTATVLFEERELPVKENILKDDFAPFERHVYRLGK